MHVAKGTCAYPRLGCVRHGPGQGRAVTNFKNFLWNASESGLGGEVASPVWGAHPRRADIGGLYGRKPNAKKARLMCLRSALRGRRSAVF
jgi:hypothetical protein